MVPVLCKRTKNNKTIYSQGIRQIILMLGLNQSIIRNQTVVVQDITIYIISTYSISFIITSPNKNYKLIQEKYIEPLQYLFKHSQQYNLSKYIIISTTQYLKGGTNIRCLIHTSIPTPNIKFLVIQNWTYNFIQTHVIPHLNTLQIKFINNYQLKSNTKFEHDKLNQIFSN